MTSPLGDYEQSYPPEILRGYVPPVEPPLVGAARRTATSAATGTLTVTAGEPGTYEPETVPADRPRNVTELRERARVDDDAPWPVGAYVLIGTSGKRAHWGGDDWHGGESPGYSDGDTDEPADDEGDAPEPTELDDAEPDEDDADR